VSQAAPTLHRFKDAAALFQAAAGVVRGRVAESIAQRGSCRLALAGGSTPLELHRSLRAESVEWPRVHVFFGDERCVPPDRDGSNYRMAKESLLDHVSVREDQVHRIQGELSPEAGAADYAIALGALPLDVAILGLGSDGHTASLFPDTPGLAADRRSVLPTLSPVAPANRVSLSLRTLCQARSVVFLVLGGRKAKTLATVWRQLHSEPARLPAALVRPEGELLWFVDEAAASSLSPETGADA